MNENVTLVNTVVAASPTRPNRALVTSDTIGGALVRYAWTSNSGRSWHPRVLRGVTQESGGTWDSAFWTSAGVGLQREAYVVTSARRDCESAVLIARSPVGRYFQRPQVVTQIDSCDSSTVKTWVAVDTGRHSPHRGRVHVSWMVAHSDAGQQQFVSHSDDRGRSWSEPLPLSPRDGFTHFNSLVVQPDGDVTVLYLTFDLDDPVDVLDMVARTSGDGGRTFAPEALVTQNTFGFTGTVDNRCCMPTLAVDRATGWMYMAQSDERFRDDDLNDVLLWRSRDGSVWQGPVLVSGRRDGGRSVERFSPSVGAHNGRVFVVWTRRFVVDGVPGDHLQQEAAVSRDAGRSFGRPRVVGPSADIRFSPPSVSFGTDHFTGDYNTTSVVPGRAYTGWARPVQGRGDEPHQPAWVAVLTSAHRH